MLVATQIGCSGGQPDDMRRPNHLAFDVDGHLLVADPLRGRVIRLSTAGRLDRIVGRMGLGEDEFWGVQGLAGLPDGGFVVLDYRLRSLADQTDLFAELKLHDRRGRVRKRFELVRRGLTGEGYHEGIAVLPDGFAVADSARDALILVSRDGAPIRTIQEVRGGPPLSAPMRPRYRLGQLWVAEYRAHRVRRLTLEGEETLRVDATGEGPGQLRFPWAVDPSPEGWFVVADLGNYRLQRFDADGRFASEIRPEPAGPTQPVQLVDVRLGPDGLIYAADSKGNRILVLQADGTLVRAIHRWD